MTSLVARSTTLQRARRGLTEQGLGPSSVPWETLLALIAIPQRGRPPGCPARQCQHSPGCTAGVCLRAPSSKVSSGQVRASPEWPWGCSPSELALIIGLTETEQDYPCPQGAPGTARFPRRQETAVLLLVSLTAKLPLWSL